MSSPAVDARPAGRPRWGSWQGPLLQAVGLLLAGVVVVLVLRGRIPPLPQLWSDLGRASSLWVLVAGVLQVGSIGLVAHQQRLLLRSFGVPTSGMRMQAVTYASGAVALSFPAGGVVSSGYAFRRYRGCGATTASAAAVMMLSGLWSTVGLLAVGGAGLAVTGLARLDHPVLTGLVTLSGGAVLVLVVRQVVRRRPGSPLARRLRREVPAPTPRLDRLDVTHPRLAGLVRQLQATLGQVRRTPARELILVVSASAGKWLLDALCLYASCLAVGFTLAPAPLIGMFLGVQLVRQLPLTPGGAGLVEAALLTGLLATGIGPVPAAAAVLIYRLVSAWLVIPVGFLAMLWLRGRDGPSPSPVS